MKNFVAFLTLISSLTFLICGSQDPMAPANLGESPTQNNSPDGFFTERVQNGALGTGLIMASLFSAYQALDLAYHNLEIHVKELGEETLEKVTDKIDSEMEKIRFLVKHDGCKDNKGTPKMPLQRYKKDGRLLKMKIVLWGTTSIVCFLTGFKLLKQAV